MCVGAGCGLGRPAISGEPVVGETLTPVLDFDTHLLDFDRSAYEIAYQWMHHDGAVATEISGATHETYTVAQSDLGKLILVKVYLTETGDTYTYTTRSLPTGVVASTLPTVNSWPMGLPVITGTARIGETLTASTASISDSDGLTNATFAYPGSFQSQYWCSAT